MIRLACQQDMPRLLEIYDIARQFMRQNGNDVQWVGNYPAESDLAADIAAGRLDGGEP